jgi:hypothetical protein
MKYKVATDSATIGIFTLDSISTDIYGKDYDEWVDTFDKQPSFGYLVSISKYTDKGVIIETESDGLFNVYYNENEIVIPVINNYSNKCFSKIFSTLKKTKYLLISSTESMFDHRIKYKKIVSMMEKNNKKIHKFHNGGGIIIKVDNKPKKVNFVAQKKIVLIKIN